MTRNPREYIAVQVQIVTVGAGWKSAHYSDLIRHPTIKAAVRHGMRQLGHDDFVIAHMQGETLMDISWQHEMRPSEPESTEERADMAAEFGWKWRDA